MPNLEIDHVYAFSSRSAPEAAPLLEAGLRPGRERQHHGQGTANRCFFFDRSMLELIWIEDEEAAKSPLVEPLSLWGRSQWRRTGMSPFGVCLRMPHDDPETLPFASAPYRPPYLPEGVTLHVASDLPPTVPLLFGVTSEWNPPDVEHPLSGSAITRCVLQTPGADNLSMAVRRRLPAALQFERAPEHLLEIEIGNATTGQTLDLRRGLGLILRW